MPDLDQQLVNFASLIDDTVAPVEVGEAMQRLAVKPRWLRKPAAAVAFASLMAAAIGLIVLIAPMGPNDPVVEEGPPTTPITTAAQTTTNTAVASTVPTSTPAAQPMTQAWGWTRIDLPTDTDEAKSEATTILSTSRGLITGGRVDDRAALWISDDGSQWELLADPTGVFGGTAGPRDESTLEGHGRITGLAEGDGTLVAVGNEEDRGNPETSVGVVWYSVDGVSWERADHDQTLLTGYITDVAYKDKFVAIGGGPDSASSWTSTDGREWTRHPAPAALNTVHAAHGGFFAGGSTDDFVPGIWLSIDGIDWRTADLELGEPTNPSANATEIWGWVSVIIQHDDGYLAGGGLGDWGHDAALWSSPDGASWDLLFRAQGSLNSDCTGIAVIGDVILVSGYTYSPNGAEGAVLWISADRGATWSSLDDTQLTFPSRFSTINQGILSDGIAYDGRFIVSGSRGSTAAIWIGEPDRS